MRREREREAGGNLRGQDPWVPFQKGASSSFPDVSGCLIWVTFLISSTFTCMKVTLIFLGFSFSVKKGLDQRVSEDLL